MYEAKQCKEWVTADIDTSQFSKNQTFKVEVQRQFLPFDIKTFNKFSSLFSLFYCDILLKFIFLNF